LAHFSIVLGLAGRILRPPTLGLLLLFGVTAYWGASIVAFEQLTNRVSKATNSSSLGGHQTISSVLEPVAPWTNTTGVAARARSLVLEILLTESPGDISAIERALGNLAETSPTSSGTWQALVQIKLARGEAIKEVLDAFRMSALTGSHEGYVMRQRAIFGLEHWTELSELDRRTVIRDVVPTVHLEHRYSQILAAKSEAEREDIRSALAASGLATKDVLHALGV
jgi:hypothetical protein